mmetsp:Transcript_15453/g.33355  ORF Transcript_15453/g.33355 Transcript_15453/m.33355 type:complete len:222 (+) Transcript_15453:1475-2140(+)
MVTCIGSRGIPNTVLVAAPRPPSSIPFCSSPLKSLVLLIRADNSGKRSFKKLKKWVSGSSLVVGTQTRLVEGPSGLDAAACCCLRFASVKPGRASATRGVVVAAGAEPHRFRFRSVRSPVLGTDALVGTGTEPALVRVVGAVVSTPPAGVADVAIPEILAPAFGKGKVSLLPVAFPKPKPALPVIRAAISFAFCRASSAEISDILCFLFFYSIQVRVPYVE